MGGGEEGGYWGESRGISWRERMGEWGGRRRSGRERRGYGYGELGEVGGSEGKGEEGRKGRGMGGSGVRAKGKGMEVGVSNKGETEGEGKGGQHYRREGRGRGGGDQQLGRRRVKEGEA